MALNEIASSTNLYLDSNRIIPNSGNRGDSYDFQLGSRAIQVHNGERLRVVLQEFNMAKVWSDVNSTNNEALLRCDTAVNPLGGIEIQSQNYKSAHDLATAFANALIGDNATGRGLLYALGGVGVDAYSITGLLPDSSTGINGTTDNIIQFTLTPELVGVAQPQTLTNIRLQMLEIKADMAELIGGNTQKDATDTAFNSISITSDATSIVVKCLYPCIRTGTCPYIYLRTNLNGSSQQSASINSDDNTAGRDEIFGTNLIGRIPVNTEYCNYTALTERAFYLDLGQHNISSIRLYITDNHNRPINREAGSSAQTASGTGLNQSTLCNLNFSAVLRVDVLLKREPSQNLNLMPPTRPMGKININPKT